MTTPATPYIGACTLEEAAAAHNGTKGRVYTQEVRPIDPDAQRRAEEGRRRAEACFRQPTVCAAMDLLGRLPWSSGKVGGQVGPVGGKIDSQGKTEFGVKTDKKGGWRFKPSLNGEVCIRPREHEYCLEWDLTSPIGITRK